VEEFRGQRVVVVGDGTSAVQLLIEIATVSRATRPARAVRVSDL
jgi:cation diffusion facilitator CzcD-associated flavoprotein CzcO